MDAPTGIDRNKLFLASCFSLIATSVAFAVVGGIMNSLKGEFVLTNAEVGWIGGAALWGFAVSQLIFAPLCDTLGMRFLLRLAFLCHSAGVVIMMLANGFWVLFFGALVIALGNGLVEAACNPLVATLYPDDKTVKLNRFHVWFPGGIVIGGVSLYLLNMVGVTSWQIMLCLILIPTMIYGYMIWNATFPPTENVQAGVTMGEMFKATFTTPFMLLMLFCMAITASTELGPNRWVPAVLEAGGMAGILVLAYINGLMALMRYKAGAVVHRISPTGVLFISAIISAIGLYALSYSETLWTALLSATVFAVGICYFWPTMLGVVSERVPRSGALGLGLMGAVGMAVSGLITSPQMGAVADREALAYLEEQGQVQETVSLLESVAQAFPDLAAQAPGDTGQDIDAAVQASERVVTAYGTSNTLPANDDANTLNALRAVTGSGATSPLVGRAQALLGPADNYGGRMSFRSVVWFTLILIPIFGFLYFRDRAKGGYKAERLTPLDAEGA